MTEVPPEVDADTGAALDLVRVFAEHGHSVEAVKATADASLLTIAVALCFLTSRVTWTVARPGCGCSVQVEHAPGSMLARAPAGDHNEPDDVRAQQIREDLACEDCPAEVRVTEGAKVRARVIHSATCPWYRRHEAREVAGCIPCGVIVTHRGPYKRDPGA